MSSPQQCIICADMPCHCSRSLKLSDDPVVSMEFLPHQQPSSGDKSDAFEDKGTGATKSPYEKPSSHVLCGEQANFHVCQEYEKEPKNSRAQKKVGMMNARGQYTRHRGQCMRPRGWDYQSSKDQERTGYIGYQDGGEYQRTVSGVHIGRAALEGKPQQEINWNEHYLHQMSKKVMQLQREASNLNEIVVAWVSSLETIIPQELKGNQQYQRQELEGMILKQQDTSREEQMPLQEPRIQEREANIKQRKTRKAEFQDRQEVDVQEWESRYQAEVRMLKQDAKIQELYAIIRHQKARLHALQAKMEEEKARISENNAEMRQWQARLQDQEASINKQETSMQEQEARLQKQRVNLQERVTSIEKREISVQEWEANLQVRETKVEEQEARMQEHETSMQEREASIREQEASMQEQKARMQEWEANMQERENRIQEQETRRQEQEASMQEREASIQRKEISMREREANMQEHEASIQVQETKLKECKASMQDKVVRMKDQNAALQEFEGKGPKCECAENHMQPSGDHKLLNHVSPSKPCALHDYDAIEGFIGDSDDVSVPHEQSAGGIIAARGNLQSFEGFLQKPLEAESEILTRRRGVISGGPSDLIALADHLPNLKQLSLSQLEGHQDGVILDKELVPVRGRYHRDIQYSMVEVLGRGSFGDVHLMVDKTSRRKFAGKQVILDKFESSEAKLWCGLDHPHIVRLLGLVRTANMVLFLSEYRKPCQTLQMLVNQSVLGQGRALFLMEQLFEALAYLHAKRIIHKDIKPGNILVSTHDHIWLIDFGLSIMLSTQPFANGPPAGTVYFMAPEVAGSKPYNELADVWSAGCTLIALISGHPPWAQRFKEQKCKMKIVATREAPLQDIPANTDPRVHQLLKWILQKELNQRPSASLVQQRWPHDIGNELYNIPAVIKDPKSQPHPVMPPVDGLNDILDELSTARTLRGPPGDFCPSPPPRLDRPEERASPLALSLSQFYLLDNDGEGDK